MSVGTSKTFTDTPDQDAVTHHMPDAIRDLLATAQKELLITNAYIIPDQKFLDRLAELVQRGVKVRILTNSLATHDVPAVSSHYKQWREPLIKAGVDLYEMRPDAEIRREIADRAPVESGFMGLHTKAIVVDRARVFIGSMNLDPRSIGINSEMGVVIDSPNLAEKLAAVMLRDMEPENSWHVVLSPDGELLWVSTDEVLDIQPARDYLQRVEDQFFMMFPKDYY
jgi:putative cardiolipin synthase